MIMMHIIKTSYNLKVSPKRDPEAIAFDECHHEAASANVLLPKRAGGE